MSPLLTFILVVVVVSLGPVVGAIIARFTKEELADGRKYFLFAKKLLFSLIVALLLYYLVGYWGILSIILLLILLKFARDIDRFTYPLLPVILLTSYLATEHLFIIAVLCFTYGLLSGTTFYYGRLKKKK